jgi:hypothetical protein
MHVEAINIGPSDAITPVESVTAVAGVGRRGDRHFYPDGAAPGQALTLIEAEALEEVALSGAQSRLTSWRGVCASTSWLARDFGSARSSAWASSCASPACTCNDAAAARAFFAPSPGARALAGGDHHRPSTGLPARHCRARARSTAPERAVCQHQRRSRPRPVQSTACPRKSLAGPGRAEQVEADAAGGLAQPGAGGFDGVLLVPCHGVPAGVGLARRPRPRSGSRVAGRRD